jgi:hypothetical protein
MIHIMLHINGAYSKLDLSDLEEAGCYFAAVIHDF